MGSDKKFNKLYTDMAKQRSELDENLGAMTQQMNDKIATQAALADSRFRHTVKDIDAARVEAAENVAQARKDFSVGLIALVTTITEMDSALSEEVQKVATELKTHQAEQAEVNRHV